MNPFRTERDAKDFLVGQICCRNGANVGIILMFAFLARG
jgi:hypothetical protein